MSHAILISEENGVRITEHAVYDDETGAYNYYRLVTDEVKGTQEMIVL